MDIKDVQALIAGDLYILNQSYPQACNLRAKSGRYRSRPVSKFVSGCRHQRSGSRASATSALRSMHPAITTSELAEAQQSGWCNSLA